MPPKNIIRDNDRGSAVEIRINSQSGKGRLDSVVNAPGSDFVGEYKLDVYEDHSLETGSTSKAAAYIGLKGPNGEFAWVWAPDEDIINASVRALICAINCIGK